MLYLLYGTENYLIKKEIAKIFKENNIEDINISEYDLESDNFKDIIEDALTISMFGSKKGIIVNNSYIFTGKNIKTESNPDIILNYLSDANPDTVLIFITDSEKLDERKKVVKELKKNGSVKEFNKNKNLNSIIIEMCDDYMIDNKTINYLINRCGSNLDIINQEIEKIKIYKSQDKSITEEDIRNLTSENVDINIFNFVDKLLNKDKISALEMYSEMVKNGEEPIKMLVILANQIRIMYQAQTLYKKGYSGNDIASMLEIHPYRIKLALEKCSKYESKTLLSYLSSLADLDYNIKSGVIESDIGLELFILNTIK